MKAIQIEALGKSTDSLWGSARAIKG